LSNDCNNRHGHFSARKSDSQNELFELNENYNNKYTQEKEECDSIANSFDAIVDVIKQYKNDVAKPQNSRNNEISVSDTVNIGFNADTFLTDVRVMGLNNLNSQNITMKWGEDLVSIFNNNRCSDGICSIYLLQCQLILFTGKKIFNSVLFA